MPRLQEFSLMVKDNAFNLVEFACGKAIISGQERWIQPELGLVACGFDMNMWRFLTFVAKEIEPEPADTQNGWHHSAPITVLPPSYRIFLLLANAADVKEIALAQCRSNEKRVSHARSIDTPANMELDESDSPFVYQYMVPRI
jgi:hypothetical protein